MQDFYDTEGFEELTNVSINNRMFQSSIVIKQDPNKSGILSFFFNVEDQQTSQSESQQGSSIRPSDSSGGYP